MKSKYRHLYVVTRRDLTPGYQGVQSQHALAEFAYFNKLSFEMWRRESNYLSWLSVKDEKELRRLARKIDEACLQFSVFLEPDLDYQMTAIAIEPGRGSARILKRLPLALRGMK